MEANWQIVDALGPALRLYCCYLAISPALNLSRAGDRKVLKSIIHLVFSQSRFKLPSTRTLLAVTGFLPESQLTRLAASESCAASVLMDLATLALPSSLTASQQAKAAAAAKAGEWLELFSLCGNRPHLGGRVTLCLQALQFTGTQTGHARVLAAQCNHCTHCLMSICRVWYAW